jgi:hypothetical protein
MMIQWHAVSNSFQETIYLLLLCNRIIGRVVYMYRRKIVEVENVLLVFAREGWK